MINKEYYDYELFYVLEHPDAQPPIKVYGDHNAAGYDLTAIKDVTINAHDTAIIPVGMRVIIPYGWWANFCGRSSLGFIKQIEPYGVGVLDSHFSGDLSVRMYNRSNKNYTISKGDRFCQLMLHRSHLGNIIELTPEQFVKKEEEIRKLGGRASEKKWGSSGK